MKRALFIWFKRYDSILEGGGLVNMRNYAAVQQILGEENVDSYYIHQDEEKPSLTSKLRSAFLFLFTYHNGLTPKKVKEIVSLARNYDFVFLNTTVFGIVAKRLKEAGYQGQIIAHFHNIESQYYNCLLPKHMPFRRVIILSAFLNDGFCCRYADHIVALNKRDSNQLFHMYGRKADAIVPITLPDRYANGHPDRTLLTGKKPTCLFLGSNFTANAEGVLWFVHEVLPHVDIHFRVVGKGMARLKEEHACLKDIEVISDAPSLTPYLEEADFMILPVFSGSGMKVKTCEALMYGKNILGTDETLEGYDMDDNQVGARCNTAAEYIEAIRYYIEHPILRFHEGYIHGATDEDYSMTAIRNGFPVLVTPQACGYCEFDHFSEKEETERLIGMNYTERKKYVFFPTHSDHDYLLFVKRNMPQRYIVSYMLRKIRLYLPSLYYKICIARGIY